MPRSHHRASAQATARRATAIAAHCQVSSVTVRSPRPSVSPRVSWIRLVGVGELGPGRGLVGGAAGRFGDVLERSGLHRHGDRLPTDRIGDRAVGRAEGDREHRHAGLGGGLAALGGRTADRGLTVGEQHHRPWSDVVCARSPARCLRCRRPAASAGGCRLRVRRRSPSTRRAPSCRSPRRALPGQGSGDLVGHVAAEGDQADFDVVVHLVDEVPSRLLRRLERVGSTSVACIDSDTSKRTTMRPSLSVRSVDRSIGTGDRDDPRGQAGELEPSDDVAPPTGAVRERRDRAAPSGEAQRRSPPPVQHSDVRRPPAPPRRGATTAVRG